MECRVPLAFFFYLRKRRHRKYTTVNRSWPKRQPAEILLLSFVQFYTMTAEDLYTVYKGVLMPTLIHPPESLMRFERFTFRPDDVLIVTYPKSGKVRLPPHASKVFVKNKIILLKYALNNSSYEWMQTVAKTRKKLWVDGGKWRLHRRASKSCVASNAQQEEESLALSDFLGLRCKVFFEVTNDAEWANDTSSHGRKKD